MLGLVLAVADARAQSSRAASSPARSGLLQGRDAALALGPRLSTVAAESGKSAQQLADALQRDRELWISSRGKALYACQSLANPPEERAMARGAVAAPPFPVSQTFKLHSRPTAAKKIYLDFDGHVTSGTGWNQDFTNGADIVSAPFDQDGNPATFGQGEHESIQVCWMRVAEDFAPFDVDVTTEDPGVDGLRRTSVADPAFGTRVVISPTDSWFVPAGGVAYLGVFDAINGGPDVPCYAFTLNVANDAGFIAEVSSHEAGHTVGLNHDGTTTGDEYYGGANGSIWAPIMGSGYGKSLVTWSKGEYPNASNTEDDYAVMQSNSLLFRGDDHANSANGATMIAGSSLNISGVIQGVNDKDFFRIGSNIGSITVNANPAPRSPNLDIQMELLDANGQVVQTVDLGGLNATVTRSVPAGVYFVSIEGVGSGSVSGTGYSDYGSLGEYTISGNVQGGISLRVTSPNGGQSLTAGTTHSITWQQNFIFSNVKLEYSVNGGVDWSLITNSTPNDGSEAWVVPNKSTSQARVRVTSVDGAISDISDNNFSISTAVGDLFEADDSANQAKLITAGETQSHTIHVAGDEDWVTFTLLERSNVTLSMTGAAGDTVLELYGPDDSAAVLAQDDDSGPGSLSELVRTGSQALGAGVYWVRIREKTGAGTISGGYALSLATSPGGSVKLTSPNGGQTFAAASKQLITWTSFQIAGNVKLEWNDGQTWWVIAENAPNNGVYVWTVPTVGTDLARVRVSPVNDTVAQDASDGVFTITPAPVPSLQVTFPAGGESLTRKSKTEIEWTSSNVQGNVRIEYSLNGGATWTPLALSSANDGSEEWAVPDIPTLQALVRVSAVNGSTQDQSDSVFFIPGPEPDAFEEDDAPDTASEIANGATQNRSIHAAGNGDWVKIVLPAKRRIILTTAGAAGGDTVLTLFRADGSTVVASNDDYGRSDYSRIQTRAQKAGTYYARVTAKGSSTLESYTLKLQLKK